MAVLYSNNFDAEPTGALPSGWANVNGTWTVNTSNPVSGANALNAATNTNGNFVVYNGLSAQGPQKITVKQKLTTALSGSYTQTNLNYVAVRCGSGGGSGYLFALEATLTAGQLSVTLFNITGVGAYSQITTGGVTSGWSIGDVVVMEIIANGTAFELRAWKDVAESRPGVATFSYTGASHPTGHVGFYRSKGTGSAGTVVGIDDFIYEDLGAAATVPGAPTIGTAIAGNTTASIAFTAPGSDGGAAITGYTATSSPGGLTGTGAASPITVSGLTNGTGYTFTVTATNSAGTGAASAASNSVTPTAPGVSIPVTDANIYLSPFNWYSDGAGAMQANNVKASSTFAWTNMRGAYMRFKATVGASGSIALDVNCASLSGVGAAGAPTLAWSVGGGAVQTKLLQTADVQIVLASGLAAGTYECFVWHRSVYITQDGDNWTTPSNRVQLSGVTLSTGGSLSYPTVKPKTMIVYGDSITEGDLNMSASRSASSQDANQTYGFYLSEAMDAEVGIVGFYGKAWSWFTSSWASYSSGKSRLIGGLLSPAPDYVVINYGENNGDPGPASSAVTTDLAAVKVAAPSALIVLNIPFSGKARTNLSAATLPIGSIRTDLARYEFLPGKLQWAFDGQHPTAQGHANIGALLAAAIRSGTPSGTARTITLNLVDSGNAPSASLSALKWAFWEKTTPDLLSAPRAQGSIESTDAGGQIVIPINTTLASGATGWLIVTDSDGTTGMTHKAFSGPVVVS